MDRGHRFGARVLGNITIGENAASAPALWSCATCPTTPPWSAYPVTLSSAKASGWSHRSQADQRSAFGGLIRNGQRGEELKQEVRELQGRLPEANDGTDRLQEIIELDYQI